MTDIEFAKKVMKKARAFVRNEPWFVLPEEYFFAVELPGDDELWFGHFMGSSGEHQAVAFYRGVAAFRCLVADIKSQNEEMRSLFETSQYQIVWANRFEMGPEDDELLGKLGMNYQAVNQTMLRYGAPHWIPRGLWRNDQFETLHYLLAAAEKVYKSVGKHPLPEPFSEQILLYRPGRRQGELIDLPTVNEQDRVTFMSPQVLKPLRSIVQTSNHLYVTLTPEIMPMPSGEEGSPLVLACPFLIGDLKSDMILHTELVSPDEEHGYHLEREELSQSVAKILTELNIRPQKISVSDELLLPMLEPLKNLVGIELALIEEPEMRKAFFTHFNEVMDAETGISDVNAEALEEMTELMMEGNFNALAKHPQLEMLLQVIPAQMRFDLEKIMLDF